MKNLKKMSAHTSSLLNYMQDDDTFVIQLGLKECIGDAKLAKSTKCNQL